MADLRRRPSLLTPGTALLLADTALHAPLRSLQFSAETGLASSDILLSPLCSMPLPLYHFAAHHPGARRWPGTRPEAMWHPLLWLPNRLAGRYTYPDPVTGEDVRESDEVWAIRVALELTASGLYDPEPGTWVDILATVGLDVDNDFDVARVQEWLDGAPDETLDSIDLSAYLTVAPSDWALADALALLPLCERSAWALAADEMFAEIERVADPDNGMDDGDFRCALVALAATGMALFAQAPAQEDQTRPGAFFLRAFNSLDDGHDDQAALTALVDAMSDRLHAVREQHWSALEELHGLGEPQEAAS